MIGFCLAAGAGSRLEPLTRSTPKPLLAPAGRPLIDLAVEALQRAEDPPEQGRRPRLQAAQPPRPDRVHPGRLPAAVPVPHHPLPLQVELIGVAGRWGQADRHRGAGPVQDGGQGGHVGGVDHVVGGGDQHRVVAVAEEAEPGGVDQPAAGAEQLRLDHHLHPGPVAEPGDQLVGAVVGVDHHPGRPGRPERLDGQVDQGPSGRGQQRLGNGPGQRQQPGPGPGGQAEPDHRGGASGVAGTREHARVSFGW